MAAILEGLDARLEISLVGVRIDLSKHGPSQPGILKDVERRLGDRHRRETAIGDQQRLADAEAFAGFGQFGYAPATELDGGRIAPVGSDIAHAVTFLRW